MRKRDKVRLLRQVGAMVEAGGRVTKMSVRPAIRLAPGHFVAGDLTDYILIALGPETDEEERFVGLHGR